MLAALATALVALAAPLIGSPFDEPDGDGGRERLAAPTILHPRTLQPVDDAPRLPRETRQIEVSPRRDRVAGIERGDIVFASTRTGRYLDRMEVPGGIAGGWTDAVLSWIAADRLLLIDHTPDGGCGYECGETRIRVIDPRRRVVVGEPHRLPGDFRTARVGDRQLVLSAGVFVTWSAGRTEPLRDQVPSVVVLDDRGLIEHTTQLPGLVDVVALDRSLIAVMERDPLRPAVYRYDARRGTIAARRAFELQEPVHESVYADFLLPSPGAAAIFGRWQTRWQALDRSSLEPIGSRWGGADAYWVFAAGPGVAVVESDDEPAADGVLMAYTADGRRRWRRRTHGARGTQYAAIGRYIYVQHTRNEERDGARTHVDVLRVRDGRRVARVRGRFNLVAASAGRTAEQLPALTAVAGR